MAAKTTGPNTSDDSDNHRSDDRNDTTNHTESEPKNAAEAINVKPANTESSVFNYSSVILTEPMKKLLNRGLNFAILPLKLDITQVLVDFRKFERSVIWKEFWHKKETENEPKEKIFKTEKTNMPRDHKTPEGLKTFLGAVKSDFMDPRNRNQTKCNLPVEELNALKELVKLEKQRKIIIKPNDKGAGLMIIDFDKYLKAAYDHLNSKLSETKPYYKKLESKERFTAEWKIKEALDEGLKEGYIDKEEYKSMEAKNKDPAKFYINFKVHKEHEANTAPPPRPIVSGSGSMCENLGKFVHHHIKHEANKHETYLKDTPHFLRSIRNIKGLPKNAILATMDVKALYTNIQHEEGLESLNEALEERQNKEVPSDYLVKLMNILLRYNVFTFNEELYSQEVGAPMGSPPVPDYANMFMDRKIDRKIKEIAEKYLQNGTGELKELKRFLDDIFMVFCGKTKDLHAFLEEVNLINKTIQLTMSHTSAPEEAEGDRCNCEGKTEVPFLDTMCSIKNGKIETTLFRKDTDRNQYLLPSSCHPRQTTLAIPYSLATRVVRVCSNPVQRDQELEKLKCLLLERDYKKETIDRAINKAKAIPRNELLKPKPAKTVNSRPVFAVKFDPRLPPMQASQAKHWRSTLARDPHLKEVFPQPPLTGFKRQKNLRDHLIRAKVPEKESLYPTRQLKGMTKCNRSNCRGCPFIKETKSVNINSQQKWNINKTVNCNSENLIYLIECDKENCTNNRYIGETSRTLRARLAEHRGYVTNHVTEMATGAHFNLPGHSVANLKITIIEQVKKQSNMYRKEREDYFIKKFNTYHAGLNRK